MDTETKTLWETTREAMGRTWKIELWPDDAQLAGDSGHSEALGKSWYTEQWIKIAAKRPVDGRDETLLHEVIHLAAKCAGVTMRENDVFALTNSLFAFLRGFGLWRDFLWPDREKFQPTPDVCYPSEIPAGAGHPREEE